MGGLGSGGHPAGGRKPKSDADKHVHGSRNRGNQAASLPEVDEFDAPNDLTVEERHVWLRLAPGAFKARTLTKATEYAFILLCRNVLLEQRLRVDPELCGGANHRGILQRVETGLTAFGLRALGKPMQDEVPKVVDPFDEFESGSVQ